MTLIVTSRQPTGCLLTADGASWSNGQIVNGQLQKIFPLPGAPLAIGQHGRNELGGLPVAELVQEFIALRGQRLPSLKVFHAAECLAAFFHPHAYATMKAEGQMDARLLLVGYGPCCPQPHAFELEWQRAIDGRVAFRFNDLTHDSPLLLSGDARQLIEEYFKKEVKPGFHPGLLIHKVGFNFATEIHDELFRLAVERGRGACRPAGHRHRLAIERSGWRWEHMPTPSAARPLGCLLPGL